MKLFDEIPYLEDDYIILKAIEPCDAAAIEKMSADAGYRKYLPTFLFEFGFEDKAEAVKEMYGAVFTMKRSLHMGIHLKEGGCGIVGIAEFYNYEPNWNKVSVGVRIGREYWHRGIAGHVIRLLVDYLFERTDVKRVTAHVNAANEFSFRAAMHCGFRLRRQHVAEDWGHEQPDIVNKYIAERWDGTSSVKIGSGPKTMVILPGLALKSTLGGADSVAKNYSAFKDYTIYLFDDRDEIDDDYSLRERAGDVAGKMKDLGLSDAYVFGASMGGIVGQYLAIDHPDLVKKLFVSSACARPNPQLTETVTRWRDLAAGGHLSELIEDMVGRIYSPEIVRRFGTVLKEGMGGVTAEELEKFVILTDAILGADTSEELRKIRCPMFVTGAEGDRIVTPAGVRELAELAGCGLYIYGPEYGHGVYDEAPDHRTRILEFFEK